MSIFASKMFLFICKGISMSYWEKIKNFIKGKRVLKTSAFFKNSTTKHSMNHCCTLKMSTKTEEIKKEISQELKAKIKKYIKTPEKLVQYLQLKGVEVYKLKNAEKILSYIGEEEGFIVPTKGFRALALNFILGNKLSFRTNAMVVFEERKVEIYTLIRALYKFYGYDRKLPGYDYASQEVFKRIYANKGSLENCSMKDIFACKEALARDMESIKFTVELSTEYDNAKKALAKLKESSATV